MPNAVYYYRVNSSSTTEVFDSDSKKDFFEANNEAVNYVVYNKIKVDINSYTAVRRKKYVLFGFTILEIKQWDSATLYRVSGFPILIFYKINN